MNFIIGKNNTYIHSIKYFEEYLLIRLCNFIYCEIFITMQQLYKSHVPIHLYLIKIFVFILFY